MDRPSNPLRRRLCLAALVHAALTRSASLWPESTAYPLDALLEETRTLAVTCRHLARCSHDFPLARTRVHEQLSGLLQRLPRLAQQAFQALPPAPRTPPSLREVLAEVDALYLEFPDVAWNATSHTLSVTTDPITLEDLHLGHFSIELSLKDLARGRRRECFRVIAQSPNPAQSNDAVTHPHVSHERLCEGDAAGPIAAALTEGRLADFFTLVTCVLTTYNAASPYVSLEDWTGHPCHDCGLSISGDDSYGCQGCDHDVCQDCIGSCRVCDDSFCTSCLSDCPECGDPTCEACLRPCSACGTRVCRGCLTEGQCPPCQEPPDPKTANEGESAHALTASPLTAATPAEAA